MSSLIRVGIIGGGYGKRVLLPAFRAIDRLRVMGIVTTNPLRSRELKEEHGLPMSFESAHQMLDSGNIDAVAIAVPPKAQTPLLMKALTQKLPVYVEKPLGEMELGPLGRYLRNHDHKAVVGYEYVESEAFKKAKQMLAQGVIGTPTSIHVAWHFEGHSVKRGDWNNWKLQPSKGGGALRNIGSHVIHYLLWLGFGFNEISALGVTGPEDSQPAVTLTGTLRYLGQYAMPVSFSVAINGSAIHGDGHHIRIYGSKGVLALMELKPRNSGRFTLDYATREHDGLQPVVAAPTKHFTDDRIPLVSALAQKWVDHIDTGVPAISDFLLGGQGLSNALAVQNIIHAAELSMSYRGKKAFVECLGSL